MSYCRFGADSDVYVYASGRGDFVYCQCPSKNGDVVLRRRKLMLAHLLDHRAGGLMVPDDAIKRFELEIARITK